MTNYTVVGGQGFIGSEIIKQLQVENNSIYLPDKGDSKLFSKNLGTVIYCAGHGDCVNNPFKVYDSNTALLAKLLEKADFDKFIFISSTRVYMGQGIGSETADLSISTGDNRRLFNLTKLVSEELCLLSPKNVIVVRPSNVYGLALNSPLFLPAITRDAIENNRVDMYVSPDYDKDYVSVIDVADAICQLACLNNHSFRTYNIASGCNIKAKDIANVLKTETGCSVIWHPGNIDENFPITDISCIQKDIDFTPKSVLSDLNDMISEFKSTYEELK